MRRNLGKTQTGRCQCGEIQYEIVDKPFALYICHCQECQKQSASAFGISVEVARINFHLTQGTPKFWARQTDSGRKLKCAFCPTCGTRVWHELDSESEFISIKGGTLNAPIDVSDAIHVWTSRKLAGILIPQEAKQFIEEDQNNV